MIAGPIRGPKIVFNFWGHTHTQSDNTTIRLNRPGAKSKKSKMKKYSFGSKNVPHPKKIETSLKISKNHKKSKNIPCLRRKEKNSRKKSLINTFKLHSY